MEKLTLKMRGKIAEFNTAELRDSFEEISRESEMAGIIAIGLDGEAYEVTGFSVGTICDRPALAIHIIDRSGGKEQP